MSKSKHERYVKLRYWLLDSPAWQSLPGSARALYVQIVRRYNGSNNGRIPYSVREAMQVRVSKGMAKHLFDLLQDRGFIVCTKRGAFSLKTTRQASQWRLTEYNADAPIAAHATKEFMRWVPPEGQRAPLRNSKHGSPHEPYGSPHEPYGSPSGTVRAKKGPDGSPRGTVEAKNQPSTVHPEVHSIATRGTKH
jgi:hypothetical protein